jgi:LPXTG-motif cell wall-anchored protein
MKIIFSLFFFLVLMTHTFVQAKVFRNAYIAFEMPDEWNCTLEQTEWVCRSMKVPDMKESIIVLTAKEVGPTDSFPMYEGHLNNPISAQNQAAATQSRMIYKAKYVQVNNQQWLDGLHLGSEVPNYFTRYMATLKNKIAVLVTFSAHEKYYSKYSTMFHNAIMSMRVIATQSLGNKPEMGPLRPGSETIGQSINSAMPADMYGSNEGDEKGGSGTLFLGLIVIIGSGLGYFLYKKKRS